MADVATGLSAKRMRHRREKVEPGFFQLLDKVGSYLTKSEVNLLTIMSGRQIDESLKSRIKSGRDFFAALVQSGTCDESEFSNVCELLRLIKRQDLIHMFHVREEKIVPVDPLDEYFSKQRFIENSKVKESASPLYFVMPSSHPPSSQEASTSLAGEPPRKRMRKRLQQEKGKWSWEKQHGKELKTCQVSFKVSAEYFNYKRVLQDIEPTNGMDPPENKAECFSLAWNELESRNLGIITCDIRFSELAYLDAFWRDYLNGSLLEALKGVFITDSMKQHHIMLLVTVDEADYLKGRLTLLQNLV